MRSEIYRVYQNRINRLNYEAGKKTGKRSKR
jgi:hypothetical protein